MLDLAFFIFLGVFSGFMAGLLGIGGGILVVPGLVFVFGLIGMPKDLLMQFAAGTSLCVMIFTAISSTIAHHKHHHIVWSIYPKMALWLAIGTVLGAVGAHFMHSRYLSLVFGLFMIVLGIKMCFKTQQPNADQVPPKESAMRLAGSGIGILSGMLGIGGGAFSVPFLVQYHFSMQQASGTASALALPAAVVGTVAFMILGMGHHPVAWSTGYIYWPAVLCIAPLSLIFAPFGARVNSRISSRALRIVFAILLLLIAIKMLGHVV